jgi:kumamolisin
MAKQQNLTTVPGSDRAAPLHGAKSIGKVPPNERFEVTIRVRRQTSLTDISKNISPDNADPKKRIYLSREDYADKYGSSKQDIAAVEAYARSHGLVVVESSAARRSVFVSGTASDFFKAFGATIEQFEHDGGTYRGRTGELTVPADLAPLIEGIFGIDDRPIAEPHFQRQIPSATFGIQAHAATSSFLPTTLAKLYNFPTGVSGAKQCIGIIELGGGYRKADIDAYFVKLGIKAPVVRTVSVDGGRNQPSTPESADGEVMLDILIAAAVAPQAIIAVYFAPNTDKGFLDALTMAIHDATNKPSVISISWGSAEKNWTAQAMNSFNQALQTAAALGVTVCAASGDNGSGDAVGDGKAHVDFPASSPFMLACGGTRLVASGDAITSETVWNVSTSSATGGGVSDFFAVPTYQQSTGLPVSANGDGRRGRGVPDVSAVADPNTGYQVRVDGQDTVIGGTSAVAPLWAGLIALINQKLGHNIGFLNPLLYGPTLGSTVFNDIASGSNGAYSAKAGWDACTGWGSPNGGKLLSKLSN